MIYLFGDDYKVYSIRKAIIKLKAELIQNADVNYYLEIMPNDNGQDRYLEIDGEKISLSKQDNLSFEDLHTKVYQDLLKGGEFSQKKR